MKARRSLRLPFFLLAATLGCSGGDEGTDAGVTPDAQTPADAGATAACPPPPCAVDDAPEAAAAGDYRSLAVDLGVSIGAVALSANGRRLAVGDQAGRVHLFGPAAGATPRWTFEAEDPRAQFDHVAISRDGRRVAATDGLTRVHVFECDDSTPAWTYDSGDPDDPFVGLALSHDGCTIAAITGTRVLRFERDADAPVALHTPNISRGEALSAVALSGDGRVIAAGTWISDASGAELYTFEGGAERARATTAYRDQSSNAVRMPIAVSEDGATIAAGGADRVIHVYDRGLQARWQYDPGQEDLSVWSLAMSDDGGRLLASAGEDGSFLFDARSATPTWRFDGVAAAPHGTAVGIVDPYRGGVSPEGELGIGAYPGTVALSADGRFPVVGAFNSGHLFGLYAEKNRPFRVYSASSASDPINVTAISADGAWIAAGTTFGELLVWEVAPAVMIEMEQAVLVTLPAMPEVTDTLDLDDVVFERTMLKPGRAANLTERWRLYAIVNGVPIPPEAAWLVSGDLEQTHARRLPDGLFTETTLESMEVPQLFQTPLTAVTGFVLRVSLEGEGTGRLTSDEAAPFVELQIGM